MKYWLKPCDCGAVDWEEFEKPHGAPWYRCKTCKLTKPAIEVEVELVADFCKRAGLQDNRDAEVPNIVPSINLILGNVKVPESVKKSLQGWDVVDDCSAISPEFLEYILLMAKEYFCGD